MTIAFDAAVLSAAGTTGRSWTHTPVGTPRGVIVFISQGIGDATDEVTSVTYGGETMTEMANSPVLHTTSQPAVVYGYFLGSGIPTGAQTVVVNVDATGSVKIAAAITVTAAQDTSVVDTTTVNSDSASNPSSTLALGSVTCFCALGFHSGIPSVGGVTPFTNWTDRGEHDFGSRIGGFYTYDVIASVDVSAGWTQSPDDAVMHAVAIREDAAIGGFTPRSYPRGANRGLLRGVA